MLRYLSKFLYILQGKHQKLLILAVLFIIVSTLEVFGIGLIGPFIQIATTPTISEISWANSLYNRFEFTSRSQFLFNFGFLIVVVFYVKSFSVFSVQKYIFDFGFGYQGELCSRLMRAYLAAPYTFYLSRNTATLIQNILNETDRFCNGVMMPILTSASNIIITLALSLLLIKTDAAATLFISAILLVAYFIVHSFKDRMSRWGKEGSESITEMIRTINHGLGSLKETRVIGCEAYFENHMRSQAEKFAKTTTLAASFSTLPRYIIEALLITFLVGFTFIYLSVNQSNSQNLSAVLGVFAMASLRLLPAVSNLMNSMNTIRFSSYAMDKLYLDLKELDEVKSEAPQKHLVRSESGSLAEWNRMPFSKEVVLDKVEYRYPNVSENALNRISFTLKKGQSIGLI
ncbi:MAG: ABC transporter ATP-binding protein, partial [Leptolyngbyaceae cyanobacterium SM1_3_5]|nr:ABC transporter ATP-binding protein [Leptolyngbyaceae cyanobacterium SM1_3_5]